MDIQALVQSMNKSCSIQQSCHESSNSCHELFTSMDDQEPSIPSIVTWMETCDEIYQYINEKIINHYKSIDSSKFIHFDARTNERIQGDVIKSQLMHRMQFNEDYEKSLLLKIMNNHPSMIELFSNNKCIFKGHTIEIDSWQQGIDDTFKHPAMNIILMSMVQDILAEDDRTFTNISLIMFETILVLFNKAIMESSDIGNEMSQLNAAVEKNI